MKCCKRRRIVFWTVVTKLISHLHRKTIISFSLHYQQALKWCKSFHLCRAPNEGKVLPELVNSNWISISWKSSEFSNEVSSLDVEGRRHVLHKVSFVKRREGRIFRGELRAMRVMETYRIKLVFRSWIPHNTRKSLAAQIFKSWHHKFGIRRSAQSPTEIIKSTQKSHFQVITINNINEMRLGLLTWLMNISRIILWNHNSLSLSSRAPSWETPYNFPVFLAFLVSYSEWL